MVALKLTFFLLTVIKIVFLHKVFSALEKLKLEKCKKKTDNFPFVILWLRRVEDDFLKLCDDPLLPLVFCSSLKISAWFIKEH